MGKFINAKETNKRIEGLKQDAILKYTEELNFSEPFFFYEDLLKHLFSGDFNDSFYAPLLEGNSLEERNEIMNLACKYGFLCLYDGSLANWADSCEGIPISDDELIAAKILDNFNFLIELIKESGTLCLANLKSFCDCDMASEAAVIEYLRNTFCDDNALKMCLLEISREDSPYYGLSSNMKSKLCTFPQGILYYYDESNKPQLLKVDDLIAKIKEYEFIEEDISLVELIDLIGESRLEDDIMMLSLEFDKNDYSSDKKNKKIK